MTKTANRGTAGRDALPVQQHREPRPFLYLDPRPAARQPHARSYALLEQAVSDQIPAMVRSLVAYTLRGRRQPVSISVLNRRRRAAREWLLAVARGRVDAGTLHAVARSWIPQLAGSGPDLRRSARVGRVCAEFVRGAMTGLVISEPAENLLPEARALHALEVTLAAHLRAVLEEAQRALTGA